MFRSDDQLDHACRILLARGCGNRADLRKLWDGTPGPGKLVKAEIRGLSTYERVMVNIAMQLWSSGGSWADENFPVKFRDFRGLDEKNLSMVGSLFVALAGQATDIDAWIARWEKR